MRNMQELTFISEDRCKDIQRELATKIEMKKLDINSIKNVAGVDLAYWKETDKLGNQIEKAVCCIVIIDRYTKEIVEKQHVVGEISFPYIPGFLAFREMKLVLECVSKLEIKPDLYIFDGHGYLHRRHMGIATHASFYLDKPTIGIAKHYYKVGDDIDNINELLGKEVGDHLDIELNGEIYGRALRTMKKAKPVYVSVGNYIDLEASTKIATMFISKLSKVPLPTQQADLMTHEMRAVYRGY